MIFRHLKCLFGHRWVTVGPWQDTSTVERCCRCGAHRRGSDA